MRQTHLVGEHRNNYLLREEKISDVLNWELQFSFSGTGIKSTGYNQSYIVGATLEPVLAPYAGLSGL